MSGDRREPGRGASDRGAEIEPDLRRALEHVERPVARPEFRAELRQRFLAGAASPAAPVDAPRPAGAEPSVPPRRRLYLLAGALAAAAAIVMTLVLTKSRAPLWRLDSSSTASSVVVDGIALDPGDEAAFLAALEVARELEVRGGTLRLCVRDEAWIELADGTRLSQMKFAAAGPYLARAERGSLSVATLPDFSGRGMRVVTEDFEVQVTGTAFGVDVDAEGSCVCVLEGSVQCHPAGGKLAKAVSAGEMCFAWRDRRAPSWGPACEPHLKPLRALRQ